jgi:endonuclease YncB( thermonuclease family)
MIQFVINQIGIIGFEKFNLQFIIKMQEKLNTPFLCLNPYNSKEVQNKIISCFFGTLLFILLSSFLQPDTISGKVIGIQDGDSITLLTDTKTEIKVRLEGIDCPEKKQDFGTVAKQFTSDLVFSQNVTLQKTGQDRYGRTLGYIFLQDGTNLNEELLKAGLAWHFIKYNKSPRLSQLESDARLSRIGLWQLSTAIPPWDFRKN